MSFGPVSLLKLDNGSVFTLGFKVIFVSTVHSKFVAARINFLFELGQLINLFCNCISCRKILFVNMDAAQH